jgi:hypothetical protein
MRPVIIGCAVLTLAACAKSQDESQAAATATAAQPARVSLSALAGRWHVRGYNAAGDSLVSYELNATADTTGWTIVFTGRPPIPVHVAAVGSQVTLAAGPYASVLRPGVQVRTQGTAHLDGDSLVGITIAHYSTTGPDSVLRIRIVGKRVAH